MPVRGGPATASLAAPGIIHSGAVEFVWLVITSLASWRWLFCAYLPLAAAIAAAIMRAVPRDHGSPRPRPAPSRAASPPARQPDGMPG